MTKKQKAEFISFKLRSGTEIRQAYGLSFTDWGVLCSNEERCQTVLSEEDVDAARLASTIVACELHKGHKGFHIDGCCRTEKEDHCVVVWFKNTILVRE